jgi:hypothetical protein
MPTIIVHPCPSRSVVQKLRSQQTVDAPTFLEALSNQLVPRINSYAPLYKKLLHFSCEKTLILTASTHQSQISLSCKLEKVSGSHSVPGLIWPLTSLTWLFHAFPNRWRPRPQLDDGPQSMVEVLGHQPLGPWVAQHHTASLHAGTTETYHMYQYIMLYDLYM